MHIIRRWGSIGELVSGTEGAPHGSVVTTSGEVGLLGRMELEVDGRRRTVGLGVSGRVGGGEAVIDWRTAPLAEVFFGVEEGDEYELELEDRRLEGRLVRRVALGPGGAELPARPAPELGATAADAGPRALAGVVLDPVQRAAVEAPPGGAQLVLGAAGFGKTTVALHRVAHLEAEARAAGRAHRALVVVPTEGLRRLSERSLEALGAREVEVHTYDAWALAEARRAFSGLPKRDATDTPGGAVHLARHGALATVLPEVAKRRGPKAGADRQDLLHLFGDSALLEAVVAASDGELSGRAVRESVEHTHVQFGETTEHAFAHVDAARLVALDGEALDAGTPWADAETLDAEHAAVLFELARLRRGRARPRRYDVVVVDEAQAFAPLELAVLGRAVKPGGSLVVAGDEAQRLGEDVGLAAYARRVASAPLEDDWDAALVALGAPAADRVVLETSYRCPPEVDALARAVRRREPPHNPGGAVTCARFSHGLELELTLARWLRDLRARAPWATVGVVYRDRAAATAAAPRLDRGVPARLALDGDFDFRPGVVVTALEEVKGLELDLLVVPDLVGPVYPEDEGSRRALYVAVTRAVRWLWLLGVGSPPAWLAGLRGRS